MRAMPTYIVLSGEANGIFEALFSNISLICGNIGMDKINVRTQFLSSDLSVAVLLRQHQTSPGSILCFSVDMTITVSRPLNWLFLTTFYTETNTATSVVVNLQITRTLPEFRVSPGRINSRLIRGSFSILQFIISNIGDSTAHNIEPIIPNTPIFTFIGLGNGENNYGNGQFNLDSGESASLSIQAMISEDMPLGEISASLYIVSDEVSQQIPVSLTVSSDLLMNLTIVVEDEYTYFASGAPLVSDAVVTLINYQRDIRTTLTTEEGEGSVIFMNIYEDRYELFVQAPNHRSLRQVILISFNNPMHVVFLQREAVKYEFTVMPTTFEDSYTFTLEADFETHVPIPVVTVFPRELDLDDFIIGAKTSFEINVTNHGLIRADNVNLDLPSHPSLEFSVFDSALGNLEALSSVTVVVRVSQRAFEKRAVPLLSTITVVAYVLRIYFSYVCNVPQFQSISIFLRERRPFEVSSPIVIQIEYSGTTNVECPNGEDCQNNIPTIPYGSCNHCTAFGRLVSGPIGRSPDFSASINFNGFTSVTKGSCNKCLTSVLGCVPTPDVPFAGCIPLLLINSSNTDLVSEVLGIANWVTCLVPSKWIRGIVKDITTGVFTSSCVNDLYHNCLENLFSRKRRQSLLGTVQNHFQSMYPIHQSLNVAVEILGDDLWLSVGNPDWVSQVLQTALDDASESGVLISQNEFSTIHSVEPPAGTTIEDVERLIDRLNNTLSGWSSGVLEPVDGANMASYSFVESTTNEINRYNEIAISKGFTSYLDAYTFSANELRQLDEWPEEEEGVCAVVRIRIEQELAITREAFMARLEIENQKDMNLENVGLEISITDTLDGSFSTHLFVISNETLSGSLSLVRAGDSWTLMSQESGSVEWLIVPLSEAAPQTDHVYAVGGTLRYTVDNENIIVPLLPTLITVTPDPSLLVHYFWERTVIGDDPFTEEVEPSVPFTLGVIVKNAGYGVASSLTLSSGQPEIIENERGLLINFMITGARIGNGSITPSLSLTLGDLKPQSTVVIRWFMVSSLQGEFKNFSATFQNINPLGDSRLSILDELEIHELSRNVRIYNEGDDRILDFLTNERRDIEAYPDALYDSRTLTKYNVSRGEVTSVEQLPGSVSSVMVSVIANVTGWVYYRYTDTRGYLSQPALTLNTTKQTSSGQIQIPPENSWITFDTDDEVLMLHLLDFTNSSISNYTVTLCIASCTAISVPFTRPTGTPPPTTMPTTMLTTEPLTGISTTMISTAEPTTSPVSDKESTTIMTPITAQSTIATDTGSVATTTLEPTINTEPPPFAIQLVNGSPRLSGSSVFIDFITTQQITSATCNLGSQHRQNCIDGHVRYDNVPAGSYIFRVIAISASGERDVVRRVIHIGDEEDSCAVHLINEGVVVMEETVSLFFQGTKAVSSFLCQLRGPRGIIGARFHTCASPVRFRNLEAGNYRFQVHPVGCKDGRRLSTKFTVAI